ncbi:MAG: FKBP-type peptidyl-prolyl cis-trans isomerase [Muribaculum sp.]|nr:FKBP-type peptidyl-prolyl cis-trans isomerase [Muribaculum sp.]
MEKIQPGKYVELGYDLYEVTPEGEKLVHQTSADDPERFIFGVTKGVIEPLEHAIDGLEAGGEFDIKVTADQAFGPYDPEQVATLPAEIFEVDGKVDKDVVKPGAVLPMMTADGYRINGVVKEVTDKDVKMDFNHPIAGKDVRFKGKITLVRDATPEELQPAQGCGCSGCGGGDCNCDDSCGCSDGGSCGCDK